MAYSLSRCLLLCFALACLLQQNANAKTIFRRTDKISDNFKQLNLPAEEIDPNVAPPEPQKVQTIDPEDVSGATSQPVEDILEEIEDTNEIESAGANDLIDETINEVESAAAPAAAAAPASSSSSASSAAAAAAASVSTTVAPIKNENDASGVAKYCKCTDSHCDCCRDFGLPLIPVRGPGCAKITYLGDQRMSVSIKYGDITLATRTISGKKARPICVGLPGGYSQFCGRVYGLSKAKENFKACLGFELRADEEVEASLRVSCFKFGPDGLRVADPEPLPSEAIKGEEDEDDDDIFGFAAGGDDEDDEDDYDDETEEPEEAESDAEDDDYANDEVEAPADADYGGFSLGNLIDELTDDDDEETTPVKPAAAVAAAVTPAVGSVRTPAAVDATRAATNKVKTSAQSKDDKGTEAAAAGAVAVVSEETSAQSDAAVASVEEAVVAAVTPAPAISTDVTTVKSKKSKKNKKNKKKKAANADSESDFAFEILNGILDFFN